MGKGEAGTPVSFHMCPGAAGYRLCVWRRLGLMWPGFFTFPFRFISSPTNHLLSPITSSSPPAVQLLSPVFPNQTSVLPHPVSRHSCLVPVPQHCPVLAFRGLHICTSLPRHVHELPCSPLVSTSPLFKRPARTSLLYTARASASALHLHLQHTRHAPCRVLLALPCPAPLPVPYPNAQWPAGTRSVSRSEIPVSGRQGWVPADRVPYQSNAQR